MAAIQALKVRTDKLKIAVNEISKLSAEINEIKNEMENIRMLIEEKKFSQADLK